MTFIITPDTLLTTIVYPYRNGQIILAERTKEPGVGLLNGYGGKIVKGETPEESAIRELAEESGIEVSIEDLKQLATLLVIGGRALLNVSVVYKAAIGNIMPSSTSEMIDPNFYPMGGLPYNRMFPGDIHWIDRALQNPCPNPITIELHRSSQDLDHPSKIVFHDDDRLGSQILRSMQHPDTI